MPDSPSAKFVDSSGKKGTDLELDPKIFGVQVNVPVMHEVVRAQLGAARSGSASTKTRGEVSGGGRKPWRQKGTGRARAGSRRSPIWVGGGITHGPTPRDFSLRINRKVKALALRSALTDRARDGKILVAELPKFDDPETKKAKELLTQWEVEGKVLFVLGRDSENTLGNVVKSFRNLPEVLVVTYPTVYTVLAADTIVFTKDSLGELSSSPKADAEADAAKRPQAGGSAALGSAEGTAPEPTAEAPAPEPTAEESGEAEAS